MVSLFFANIAGLIHSAFKNYWHYLVPALLLALVVIGFGIQNRCGKAAKIDIKSVEKINAANEIEKLKELEKTIVENQNVIKTVDERNTISELGEAEKQAAIWAKVQEVNQKILDSKAQGKDVSGEELEKLLLKRK